VSCSLLDDAGKALDAHANIDGGGLDFLNRGPDRNTQYSQGLRLLLRRIATAAIVLEGAWIDSSRVQSLLPDERMILSRGELDPSGDQAFRLMSERMAAVGYKRSKGGGDQTEQIRIQFARSFSVSELERLLGLRADPP
jgi:5-methylcytosine-specific restriction protein A